MAEWQPPTERGSLAVYHECFNSHILLRGMGRRCTAPTFSCVRYQALPALLFWGLVVAAAALSGRNPDFNWDGIAYVALALERDAGAEEAHRQSYAYLEAAAPQARFEELTASSAYREAMARDPKAFAENLRFYRMRHGYVGLLGSSHRLTGANPYLLSVGLGIAAFLLLAGAAWAWSGQAVFRLGREEGGWLRLSMLPLLLQPAALGAISLTTPDLLAAALLAWGAYFLVARAERGTAFLFFVLAVLCRPDALILGSLLLSVPAADALLARYRSEEAPLGEGVSSLGLAAGLVVVGAAAVRFGGAHPWSTVFAHTFLEHATLPGVVALDPWSYLKVVGTAILFLGSGVTARVLFCLAALATLLLCLHPRISRERRLYAGAVLASWIAFFFLFPLPLERFYAAQVVILGSLLFQGLVEARALAAERRTALGALRPSESN